MFTGRNMIEKKDSFLKEAGVKFLPFVGDNYENGISFDEKGNLMLGTSEKTLKKVLVLGESHYCDEDLTDEEMSSFTRDVLELYLDARKSGDTTFGMKTFLKFERALANEITGLKDSADIWNHLMFYNYLQVPLNGVRMSGNQEEYENASKPFFKLLEIYRPDYIIVWGYHLYERLTNDNGNQGSVLSYGMETWEYDIDGKRIKVLPVRHPVVGFSWDYWHEIIVDFFNRDSIEPMALI